MLTIKKDNRVYFESDILEKSVGITHCFTSRMGGNSKGTISGLNLGFRVNDDFDAVKDNYLLVSKDFGFLYQNITAAKQTHSTNVCIVTDENRGCGVNRLSETFEADALVTNIPQIPLTVFYADCVPILLFDCKNRVVAAVHSGWRGTVGKISQKTVEVMRKNFNSDPKNILAAIGPSIGPCCFETGEEVAIKFDMDLCYRQDNGKFRVDLWEANRRILTGCGVSPQNIDVLELCTVCRKDILYSYRTHKESTGRMGAFIMLKDE